MMLDPVPPAKGAPSSTFARNLGILLLLDATVVLAVLPRLTLWNIDEARISEVSREMALTGDFLTPRIGEVPFPCYPPLPYWLMAASGSVFGWNEFAMRLPNALAGIALVGVIGLLTRRLAGDRAGLAAAAVLATLPGFFVQEKMCRADVLTMFLAVLAFDRFVAWADSPPERRRTRDLLAMYVVISLGVLSKGPIAIAMLGLGGLAWFGCRSQWKLLARMGWGWGVPLAAAIIVPWYVLVHRQEPPPHTFLSLNLMGENLRALTDGFEQAQPWYFYLRIAPPLMLPWLLALAFSWKVRRARGLSLALLWLAASFAFLSIAGAKRPSYVTYMQPALAAAVGITLAALWHERPELARRGLWGVGGLLAAAGAAVLLVLPRLKLAERIERVQDLFPAIAAALVGAGLAIALIAWRRGPVEGCVTLAGVVAVGLLVSGLFLEPRWEEPRRQGRDFCIRIRGKVPQGERLSVIGPDGLKGAFDFYYGTPMPRRSGEPGYYLLVELQRKRLEDAGKKIREIDALLDPDRQWTYLAQVTN